MKGGTVSRRRDLLDQAALLLTVPQVAAAYGCAPGHVRAALLAGRLRGHKVGPVWVVLRADAEAWARQLRRRRQRGAGA